MAAASTFNRRELEEMRYREPDSSNTPQEKKSSSPEPGMVTFLLGKAVRVSPLLCRSEEKEALPPQSNKAKPTNWLGGMNGCSKACTEEQD